MARVRLPRPLSHPAVALLALVIPLAACQDQKAAAPPKLDRPVLVERVQYAALNPERTFVATVRPRIESDLGFRVPGKVARRLVSVGDVVKTGQSLALLDETDLQLQREQAEAEKGAATAAVAQAQAELKRIQTLIGQGWSTAANLDRQVAVAEEAKGRLNRAERALSLAQNALSYANLRADGDGVVTETRVEPGQMTQTDKVAIRLARTAEKEAVVAVPEVLLEQVRDGEASVTLWSQPDKRYRATLRELSPSADPTTRTYQARFSLPDADAAVQLGMTATVAIADRADQKVARLPLSALYNQGAGPAVWVVDVDGRLALRSVQVQSYGAREVLVTAGVNDNDQVVALGVQKLDGGQRVRIVQALQF